MLATNTSIEMPLLTGHRRDPSGAEPKDVSPNTRLTEKTSTDPLQKDETATAILKKKKKPNSLMYVI